MTKKENKIYSINSLNELHKAFGLPKPLHPLVSVISFAEVSFTHSNVWQHFTTNFYSVALKRGQTGKMKYGQNMYDFDEGVMTLTSPKQVFSITDAQDIALSGYLLTMHPDFIQQYPLAKTIKEYGFFSYSTNEALFLSENEEQIILGQMKAIEQEYRSNIDKFSQDVIVSNVELLLVHVNRYYNRQFITRKNLNNDLLTKLEKILSDHFNNNNVPELPTVQYVSGQLHVSPTYLSDMLRNLTGLTAQQHIHEKLIEKAKELLSTTNLSVSEIAYQLGFEYSQSFNKLFKNKTKFSPLEYRQSFN